MILHASLHRFRIKVEVLRAGDRKSVQSRPYLPEAGSVTGSPDGPEVSGAHGLHREVLGQVLSVLWMEYMSFVFDWWSHLDEGTPYFDAAQVVILTCMAKDRKPDPDLGPQQVRHTVWGEDSKVWSLRPKKHQAEWLKFVPHTKWLIYQTIESVLKHPDFSQQKRSEPHEGRLGSLA